MSEEMPRKNRFKRSETLPLIVFYLLAFGISWLGFVPAIARSLGMTCFHSELWRGALIFPAIGPAVAAGLASACLRPKQNAGATPITRLKRSFLRPVSFRWWASTVMLPIGIMLVPSLVSFRIDHVWMMSRDSASTVLLFSCMSIVVNPLEEIGWRGFAQTQMQKGHNALTGALIVGVLWAIWHIPLFLMSSGPMSMSQTPFWPWAIGVVPQAILLAWLYNRTGHSLAVVSVFHVLGNISGDVLHSSAAVVSALRIAAALIVLCVAGPRLGQPQARVDEAS